MKRNLRDPDVLKGQQKGDERETWKQQSSGQMAKDRKLQLFLLISNISAWGMELWLYGSAVLPLQPYWRCFLLYKKIYIRMTRTILWRLWFLHVWKYMPSHLATGYLIIKLYCQRLERLILARLAAGFSWTQGLSSSIIKSHYHKKRRQKNCKPLQL